MYLFREHATAPYVLHDPEKHSYACDYVGGDAGPSVQQEEYILSRRLCNAAIFFHLPTGLYCPAIQVGSSSLCPFGDDWRQAEAHLMLPSATMRSGSLSGAAGPFAFYNLVCVLESEFISPQEATSAGYFGEALTSLRGRLHILSCKTEQEAFVILSHFPGMDSKLEQKHSWCLLAPLWRICSAFGLGKITGK